MARYTPNPISNIMAGLSDLNANLTSIKTALDRMLSRKADDGTNTMEVPLDMNSKRILNLPPPITNTEPLRLIDAQVSLAAALAAKVAAQQAAIEAKLASQAAKNYRDEALASSGGTTPVVYETETTLLFNTHDSKPTGEYAIAYDRAIRRLKTEDIWDKLLCLHVPAVRTSEADARLNWKDPEGVTLIDTTGTPMVWTPGLGFKGQGTGGVNVVEDTGEEDDPVIEIVDTDPAAGLDTQLYLNSQPMLSKTNIAFGGWCNGVNWRGGFLMAAGPETVAIVNKPSDLPSGGIDPGTVIQVLTQESGTAWANGPADHYWNGSSWVNVTHAVMYQIIPHTNAGSQYVWRASNTLDRNYQGNTTASGFFMVNRPVNAYNRALLDGELLSQNNTVTQTILTTMPANTRIFYGRRPGIGGIKSTMYHYMHFVSGGLTEAQETAFYDIFREFFLTLGVITEEVDETLVETRRTTFNGVLLPETQDIVYLMGTFDEAPGLTRTLLIDETIRRWKAAGLWDYLGCLQYYAAAGPKSALIDWTKPTLEFIGSTPNMLDTGFTTDVGFAGDGIYSYIDSNWNAAAYDGGSIPTNFHVAFFQNTESSAYPSPSCGMKAYNGGAGEGRLEIHARRSDTGVISARMNNNSALSSLGTVASAIGLTQVQRNDGHFRSFVDGVQIGNIDTTAGTIWPRGTVCLGRSGRHYNTAQFSSLRGGKGMTNDQVAAAYAIDEYYLTEVGVL